MRKPNGYATIFSPTPSKANLGGMGEVEIREGTFEVDSAQCGHCQKVIHVPPRAHPNFLSICRVCMRPTCEQCSAGECDVFEKKLARMEERERTLKSYGI